MKDEKLCATCEYNSQDVIIQFEKTGVYRIDSKCYSCWNNGVKKNHKEKNDEKN